MSMPIEVFPLGCMWWDPQYRVGAESAPVPTQKNVAAVESVNAEPGAVITVGREKQNVNRRPRSVVDRTRRGRRVVISGGGVAVTVNHFGAGVRAQCRAEPECEDRRYYQ